MQGRVQGSGYLLTPRVVLTAAHVVGGTGGTGGTGRTGGTGGTCLVAVPGGRPVECRVVWVADEDTDARDTALLLAGGDLVDPATAARFAPLDWGWADGLRPLRDCHATGFPAKGRRGGDRTDSEQLAGTFLAGSGIVTGRYVLADDHHVPTTAPTTATATATATAGSSPWAGMSGAALFHQEFLMGVVVADHRPGVHGHTRVEAVPVAGLLRDPGFRQALAEHLPGLPPEPVDVASDAAGDRRFEREYAAAIGVDYGRIRIFGLRQSNAQARGGWALDTAYLSLEARPAARAGASFGLAPAGGFGGLAGGPQRVERVLSGRSRVLLRGQAGSGKTTLVQWLAVRATAGGLGEELAELDHRVPLVLQLRKLFRRGNLQPRPEEFLDLDGRLCAEQQPRSWAHRVLRSGRALLLIDGLDEVPAEQREEVLEWLENLLRHYPRVWTLATVRPSAVPPGWLDHLGFEELSLCAMGEEDRKRFIERWHRASLQEVLAPDDPPAEVARQAALAARDQEDLLRALAASADLSQLTDSPLLCAMICALNRESHGVLPSHRMEIYRDALTMLLTRRDQSRRIADPERLQLSEAEQLAMLRRIAHWLARNNQVEGRHQDAVAQLERALRDLPNAARQGDAEAAWRHLLNRSGLLTETSVQTFQFVHRTFQDYLAALELEEERDFGMLAGHADDERWGDVIRMTMGHCGRRDRAELFERILAEVGRTSGDRRSDVVLLAAGCLPYAPELDRGVRASVLECCREHLPALLDDVVRWRQLATAGPDLVPLLRELTLPGEAELTPDTAWRLTFVLGWIGGAAALDLLAELVDSKRELLFTGALCQWRYFDEHEFASRVLAGADLSRGSVVVTSLSQLHELRALPPVTCLELLAVRGFEPAEWAFLGESVRELGLSDLDGLRDLGFLRDWPRLRRLGLANCPDLVDLEPLRGLPLADLTIVDRPDRRPAGRSLDVLTQLPKLTELLLSAVEFTAWQPPADIPTVTDVHLSYVADGQPLGRLLEVFPAMTSLRLYPDPTGCSEIDLRELNRSPQLRVRVGQDPDGPKVRVLGAELFPPERLTITPEFR
ncbi:NACHT domain-containing protein [Kitasatospora sp. LaBMicrA B282]|uniref:NACHT domain-containing protein n=1 Tax=Kitasatospora sp. LaBMicrA B282 TaxID=3420949 RepID=UPI003D123458